MQSLNRTTEVPINQNEMFDLVQDVENYPSFLPWCNSAEIKEKHEDFIIAEIRCELQGVPIKFSTKNKNKRPEKIEISLVEGPFKDSGGMWNFTDLGDNNSRIELDLHWKMKSFLLEKTLGLVFEKIAQKIFESFVRKAYERKR